MKRRKRILPFVVAIGLGLTISSCEEEDCTCPAPNVPSDPRSVYEGNYLVKDSLYFTGAPSPEFQQLLTYVVNVGTRESSGDTLFFNNFGNQGNLIHALELNGFLSFPQQIGNGSGLSGEGNATDSSFQATISEDILEHRIRAEKQ